ncbi:MAG TPA: NAD(P)-dependent alcohol dehydrogenase [Gammaproteobacteria bacterium]|nr:NAD(P)-dependent alcohol dehydrogenase [Gammaproteobacteria bacterium]
MQAIVYRRYGSPDMLRLDEIARPKPAAREVLVRVHSAAVNAADRILLRGQPFLIRLGLGLTKPRRTVLGFDLSGRVESVGAGVSRFRPNDEVFGASKFGAFAEYACVAEDTLAPKPANVSFARAAATPTAAYTALQGLRDKGGIRAGQSVLIDGASGGVGTFAIQIAKAFGAEVTAVCSTRNVEIARSIGADHVIDYRREAFGAGGRRYDLILAANAYRPIRDYVRALKPNGTYVMTGGGGRQLLQALTAGPLLSMTSGKKIGNLMAIPRGPDIRFLKELLEARKIDPVIERTYPLASVPEALRYMEQEHARGKLVITVSG